jgi:hypothetical protein
MAALKKSEAEHKAAEFKKSCAINEALNSAGPGRCYMSISCRGDRTCNNIAYCVGDSNCPAPAVPALPALPSAADLKKAA